MAVLSVPSVLSVLWPVVTAHVFRQSLDHALSEPCLHISRLCARWVGCDDLNIDKMPCYKLVQLALLSVARNADAQALGFVLHSGEV